MLNGEIKPNNNHNNGNIGSNANSSISNNNNNNNSNITQSYINNFIANNQNGLSTPSSGVTITTVPITSSTTTSSSSPFSSSTSLANAIHNFNNSTNVASTPSQHTITTLPAHSGTAFNFNGISNPIIAAAQAVSQKSATVPHIMPTPTLTIPNAHANGALKRRPHQVCFFCEKKRLPCSEERPCAQCVKEGMGQLCLSTNIPSSPTTSHLEKKRTKISDKRAAARKPLMSSQTEVQQPTTTAAAVAPSIPSITFSNKIVPDFLKGKELNETQMYILNELFKLRMDNQMLREEIQTLKNGKTLQHVEEQQKALVVFDLTKKTATVLSADVNFCKMLGYEMEEVLGAPWSKFVHPDYRERALNIFSSKSLSSSIELDQVYVHKNGAIVFATDVHTFLFGTNRNPVSDFVCVYLRTKLPSPASNYSEKTIKFHTTPALTYPELTSTMNPSISTISQIPSPSPPPAMPHTSYDNAPAPPLMPLPISTNTSMDELSNYDLDGHNSFITSDNSLNITPSPPQYDYGSPYAIDPFFNNSSSNHVTGANSSDVPMEEGSPVFDLEDESLMNAISSYSPLSDWNPNS
eukprot:TRINITY_DN330_c0_g1_i1.p1 TRINITY_DN330_c0_g1~~TRINITY_DN330_c0_g1_i1.p1  ORF type:complete len:579 (+),score=149.47 TRINITY_DN330_c0_g1_i1:301-2037(+)